MSVLVRYTIYGWKPPDLPVPERIWLGGEIAKVGKKPFVVSLKRRLGPKAQNSSNKSFTFADIIRDAENMNKGIPAEPRHPLVMQLVALLLFGVGLWWVASHPPILILFLFVVPISIGSLLFMNNEIERWVQGLVEEYARAVANGGALPPHDSMSA